METLVYFLSRVENVEIYITIAFCGSWALFLLFYVRRKFARATGLLQGLNREWDEAGSRFSQMAEVAEQRIGGMELPSPNGRIALPFRREVSAELRNQVSSMNVRGMSASEIATASGLSEAEVEVLFGMQRFAQGKK